MTETVHNRHKLFGWMLFGATVLVISSGTGYVYAYHGRMAPRTQINGVSIGYMTKAEATSVITRQEDTFLRSPLRMNYPGGVITVQPKLLGLTFNNASALDLAYANADQQTLLLRVQQLLTAPFHSHNYPDFVYPISDTGRAYLRQTLPSSVEQSATETSLSFIPNATTVNAGIAGHLVDLLAVLALGLLNLRYRLLPRLQKAKGHIGCHSTHDREENTNDARDDLVVRGFHGKLQYFVGLPTSLPDVGGK